MISAVIFDLYGTLLSLHSEAKPFSQLLKANPGCNRDRAIYLALTHECQSLREAAALANLSVPDNIDELERQLQENVSRVRLFPDSMQTLSRLREAGVRLAVISNLATPYKTAFYTHGLDKMLDEVVFSCDCGFAKPEAEIYQLALTQLGVNAQETLMIGDSKKSDVDGPAQLGILGVHLQRATQCDAAANCISTLPDIFDKFNFA